MDRQDFKAFFDFSPPSRLRGVVLEVDGKLLGAGCIVLWTGYWLAHVDLRQGAEHYKKSIYKAGLMLRAMMDDCKIPVLAYRDEKEHNSAGLLSRFGFVEEAGYWRYVNGSTLSAGSTTLRRFLDPEDRQHHQRGQGRGRREQVRSPCHADACERGSGRIAAQGA